MKETNMFNNNFYYILILVLFTFLNCTTSCNSDNKIDNSNSIQNNSNPTNSDTNKNINPNNGQNQNANINPNNLNINLNDENINTENNITNQNNSSAREKCLSPNDYSEESELNWIREKGYLSRPFCDRNNLEYIYHDRNQLSINEDGCENNSDCVMPEIEAENENGLTTRSVTTIAGNIEVTNYENRFVVTMELLDTSGNYKIGNLYFGGTNGFLNTHIPSDSLKGKRITFIERHISKITSDGIIQFATPFLKDPETDKFIFGAVTRDNDSNLGYFYNDLLPFTYTTVFKDEETAAVCNGGGENDFKYIVQVDECKIFEFGDLVIEIDENRFIIPFESEGDIIIDNSKLGVVAAIIGKRNFSTCNPEETISYKESSFYFFDREYFIPNPEYVPAHPNCNEME